MNSTSHIPQMLNNVDQTNEQSPLLGDLDPWDGLELGGKQPWTVRAGTSAWISASRHAQHPLLVFKSCKHGSLTCFSELLFLLSLALLISAACIRTSICRPLFRHSPSSLCPTSLSYGHTRPSNRPQQWLLFQQWRWWASKPTLNSPSLHRAPHVGPCSSLCQGGSVKTNPFQGWGLSATLWVK